MWLRSIDSPRPSAAQASGEGGRGAAPTQALPPAQTRRHVVEQVVEKEPERVVQALRTWMAEEDA